MRGKGRITVQYGCCYSYANPASITGDVVQELPPRLQALIDRLVRWGVVPAAVRPDSAIINIYSEGDCIPPHSAHCFVLGLFGMGWGCDAERRGHALLRRCVAAALRSCRGSVCIAAPLALPLCAR